MASERLDGHKSTFSATSAFIVPTRPALEGADHFLFIGREAAGQSRR
jgi:hypothetical protein